MNSYSRQIVLFTDFGPAGPYIGQMESVLRNLAPHADVINLISNAPAANPRFSSYLLSALRLHFPKQTVFLAVVDPGVGGERLPVVLKADEQFFVGPENGLLNTVAVHSRETEWWKIIWKPDQCSMSFHGRDLFAPVAAKLAESFDVSKLRPIDTPNSLKGWKADFEEIIYFDHYGNAITGLRYREAMQGKQLLINGVAVNYADTFSSVNKGSIFWYQNSIGLVEIAVNRGRAQEQRNLKIGTIISVRNAHEI